MGFLEAPGGSDSEGGGDVEGGSGGWRLFRLSRLRNRSALLPRRFGIRRSQTSGASWVNRHTKQEHFRTAFD